MTRRDSIRAKGLKVHVNDYCAAKGIDYNYDNLDFWLTHGVMGEPVTMEWLRRRFKNTRPTMEKWITRYNEEKRSGLS